MKKILALILAAMFCLGSTACSTESLSESSEASVLSDSIEQSQSDTSATQQGSFTAEELAELYETDKDAAKEYEDQKIIITGTCDYVSLFDKIHLDCGSIPKDVVCELEDSDDPQLDELESGDLVKVEGTLDNGFGDIELEDCEILNIQKSEADTESTVSSSAASTTSTEKPTPKPTEKPAATAKPTAKPTPKPTAKPTVKPTPEPTQEPAAQSEVVWLSRTGTKYHNNPNCGNMKNPIKSTLDDAIASGREPCKKCYG